MLRSTLDLVHQRIDEPSLAQFGEILADDDLPNFVALRPLAAMGAVERPRFVHPTDEHKRMGAVGNEPDEAGWAAIAQSEASMDFSKFVASRSSKARPSHAPG
jgi:hypothetical protein